MNILKPMKNIVTISTVCAALVFSSIPNAYASDNNSASYSSEHHKKGKNMLKRMTKALSLSEQQQAQIKALKKANKKQNETLKGSMKAYKIAEKSLIQAEIFDEKAYVALRDSYQKTFTQKALSKAKSKHAVFNVLTPEQQKKWLKIMQKRKRKSKKS